MSLDWRRALSGSVDYALRLWDLETGACLRTLEGHTDSVWSASVSLDWRRAVSGSLDKTLCVWDLETGACLAVYHAGAKLKGVALSPIVDRIVCGTDDGQVHFLTPINFSPVGPAILTAVRSQAARCPFCAHEFPPPPEVVAAIHVLTATLEPGQSPCLDLPAAAFDDPRLLAACPHCGREIRFSPIFSNSE